MASLPTIAGLFYLLKHVLWDTTNGTKPSIRQFLKGGPRLNTSLRVSFLRIINISASNAFPLSVRFAHFQITPAMISLVSGLTRINVPLELSKLEIRI